MISDNDNAVTCTVAYQSIIQSINIHTYMCYNILCVAKVCAQEAFWVIILCFRGKINIFCSWRFVRNFFLFDTVLLFASLTIVEQHFVHASWEFTLFTIACCSQTLTWLSG